MTNRWWIPFVLLGGFLSGCSSECQSVPEAGAVETIFKKDAVVQIVVNTSPCEVTKPALDSVQSFFADSLGLRTQVRTVDLAISAASEMTGESLFKAAVPVLERAAAPTVVIVTVRRVNDSSGYGFCIQGQTTAADGQTWPVAVVVLIRKDFMAKRFEAMLLRHEIGHWVEIPAGTHHLHKDRVHCSSMRCVMMPGPGTDSLRWIGGVGLSALCLGPPDFCDDCKQELAAMKKRHEQIRSAVKPAP